ncbi:NAD(P)-binding protein [Hortaea werneckii]|nr:NAD(P)-binding protein [Hortaea werneckii]
MSPPTAIVTGSSSGIGLALSKDLSQRGWAVVRADVNEPSESIENSIFVRTDISSWDQQAALFQKAFAWQNRLDFFAANAGIDDRDDIFNSISNDTRNPPKQPNMKTFDVNLTGTYYGMKLATHYMCLESVAAGKTKPGGKIIVTSSAAGIYPLPSVPQYAATKHGLIGLVRSAAPVATPFNIRINALCPAMVATGLAPPGLLESFKPEQLTPMETMLRGFVELGDLDGVVKADWVSTGRTGDVVEGNMQELIWHEAPEKPAASSYMDERGMQDWARAYAERNRNFAMQDWMKQS